MRPGGSYATYRGVEYRVVATGSDEDGEYVGLLLEDGAAPVGVDAIVQRPCRDRFAKVGRDRLDRYERVVTTGRYDGQRVWIHGAGDRVPVHYSGSSDWAGAHGFIGSRRDGWSGEIDLDRVTEIAEEVTDLLRPVARDENLR